MKFVTKIVYINKMVLRRIKIIKTGYDWTIYSNWAIKDSDDESKNSTFSFRLILINFLFFLDDFPSFPSDYNRVINNS